MKESRRLLHLKQDSFIRKWIIQLEETKSNQKHQIDASDFQEISKLLEIV